MKIRKRIDQMLSSHKRSKEALSRIPAPIYASQFPKVKTNLAGLSSCAKDKGASARNLTEEERNQFDAFTMEQKSV